MFNVKSRKLVLTLFCSLALVLVLTDGASANTQLDGHRMLRKRSPALLGRQGLGNLIDGGTKGDAGDPNQGNNNGPANTVSSVSSQVSIDLSLLGRIPSDANFLCLPVAKPKLVIVTFAYFRALAHALPPSELQLQPERDLFEFLVIVVVFLFFIFLLFHCHPSSFYSDSTE